MDGSYSAHFEHCVAVTDNGPWVLTPAVRLMARDGTADAMAVAATIVELLPSATYRLKLENEQEVTAHAAGARLRISSGCGRGIGWKWNFRRTIGPRRTESSELLAKE